MANHRISMYPSGRLVDPWALKPEDIDLKDIACALSNQCRYGGSVRRFYSVAEHSVLVSRAAERYARDKAAKSGIENAQVQANWGCHYAVWGLIHDAAEAYLQDIMAPTKRREEMAPYRAAEDRAIGVISTRFLGRAGTVPYDVWEIDRAMVTIEAPQLKASHPEWPWAPPPPVLAPFADDPLGMLPEDAEAVFLHRAAELGLT